jgi:hypothetical protein
VKRAARLVAATFVVAAGVWFGAGVVLTSSAFAGCLPLVHICAGPGPVPIPTLPTKPIVSCPAAAPTPVKPGEGIAGWFDGNPPKLPAGQAPQGIYENYGAAPFQWAPYADGCGVTLSEIGTSADTNVGNWFLGGAQTLGALSNGIHNLVTSASQWLGIFDQAERQIENNLGVGVWGQYAALSIAAVALTIILRGHRRDLPGAFGAAIWCLAIITAVTALLTIPVELTHDIDRFELSVVNTVTSAIAGQGQSDAYGPASQVTDAIELPAWERGILGSNEGPVVNAYAGRLLDGSAYTWKQAESPSGTDAAAASKKATEFSDAATAVQQADPSAYAYLTGKAGGRTWAGAAALIGVMCLVPFRLFADIMVIGSLLVFLFAVLVFPVVALLGMHERFKTLATGTAGVGFAAAANAIGFTVAAGILTVFAGVILSPGSQLPTWAAAGLVFIISLLLWRATRVLRNMTRLAIHHHNPAQAFTAAGQQTAKQYTAKARYARRKATKKAAKAVTAAAVAPTPARAVRAVQAVREAQPSDAVPASTNGKGHSNGKAPVPLEATPPDVVPPAPATPSAPDDEPPPSGPPDPRYDPPLVDQTSEPPDATPPVVAEAGPEPDPLLPDVHPDYAPEPAPVEADEPGVPEALPADLPPEPVEVGT